MLCKRMVRPGLPWLLRVSLSVSAAHGKVPQAAETAARMPDLQCDLQGLHPPDSSAGLAAPDNPAKFEPHKIRKCPKHKLACG